MKQDGRYGEKAICPTLNFDEVCKSIFGDESKYKGDPELHPMRESLFKFAHTLTPGNQNLVLKVNFINNSETKQPK